MIHPKWIVLVGLLCCAHCYENLSRRPTTVLTQSSTYNGQTASFADDGNLKTDDLNCAHTAPNNTKAWLQVDFEESYSINNVYIFYRRDPDFGDWKQYRFRQFYLDASNSSATQTTTSQRTRCYTDNTIAPYLPPNIIDIPCKQTARYVIVETTYDAPEDDPTKGAMLEICEIVVYGCVATCRNNACDGSGNCTDGCVNRYWGNACDSQCSANCDEPTSALMECSEKYVIRAVAVALQGVTESLDDVVEIVQLASSGSFVTKHAANTVEMDASGIRAAVMMVVLWEN
nr:uncharacterized protein LOC105322931 [Crassostrea gigas]